MTKDYQFNRVRIFVNESGIVTNLPEEVDLMVDLKIGSLYNL